MHCPQCGLQQISEEVLFCRDCGFSLSSVKELVIPDAKEAKAQKTRFEIAFNQGLLLLLVSLILAIILTLFQDAQLIPRIYVKIIVAIFVIAGLLRMFYPYVFGSETIHKSQEILSYKSPDQLKTSKLPSLLIESQNMPIADFTSRGFDTAEIIEPHSVTENTTKSLEKSLEQE